MAYQPEDDAWISVFRQHMDEMFNFIFSMQKHCEGGHEFVPQVDIYETSGRLVIEIDLPGFSQRDYSVTVIGSALRIEGIKRHDKIGAAMSYICLERHFGRFSRTIEIPQGFDPGSVKSRYLHGVLELTLSQR